MGVAEEIRQNLGEDAVIETFTFRGEETLVVPREHLFEVLRFLKEQNSFEMLIDLTAVDYLGRKEPRFEAVYHLLSLTQNRRLRVKTPVPESDPVVPSVVPLWKAANWLEREVYDLFGIRFEGHPDLKRILLWEGFEGHPLRKDYPLRTEPPLPEPR